MQRSQTVGTDLVATVRLTEVEVGAHRPQVLRSSASLLDWHAVIAAAVRPKDAKGLPKGLQILREVPGQAGYGTRRQACCRAISVPFRNFVFKLLRSFGKVGQMWGCRIKESERRRSSESVNAMAGGLEHAGRSKPACLRNGTLVRERRALAEAEPDDFTSLAERLSNRLNRRDENLSIWRRPAAAEVPSKAAVVRRVDPAQRHDRGGDGDSGGEDPHHLLVAAMPVEQDDRGSARRCRRAPQSD